MKSAKYSNNGSTIKEELFNAIIRVAYGEAGFFEKQKVLKIARANDEVKATLEAFSETARSVHKLQPDECPDELVEAALNKIRIAKSNKPSFAFDVYNAIFAKPIVSAVSAAVLVAVIGTSIFLNDGENLNGYNIADVEEANLQAKYALAVVGKVFSSTRKSLKEDILVDKVSKPINEGIKTVNKLFTKEEIKNEN